MRTIFITALLFFSIYLQAQIPVNPTTTYTVSVDVKTTVNLPRFYIKLFDADDNAYLHIPSFPLNASGVSQTFTYTAAPTGGLTSITNVLFDFGGNAANTAITISNIRVTANGNNLFSTVNNYTQNRIYYAPDWKESANYSVSIRNDNTISITLGEATYDEWQAQFFFTPGKKSETNNEYQLIWEDQFTGMSINSDYWLVENNCDNGYGNNELQCYRAANVSVENENAVLTAKKAPVGSNPVATSGKIMTKDKVTFKYGKLEALIKLPYTANGLWPAFWLLGKDQSSVGWPACSEIDILEMGNAAGINAGTQDRYFNGACHWGESFNGGNYPNYAKSSTWSYSLQGDYHLFTLIWDKNGVKTYVDLDKYPNASPYFEMSTSAMNVAPYYFFHKEMYIIFNLAVGGNFPDIHNINQVTAFANAADGQPKMYIKYIRLYQKESDAGSYTGPQSDLVDMAATGNTAFTIYPNPAKGGNFNITLDNSETAIFTIINLQGQPVYSSIINNGFAAIHANLPVGVYLVSVQSESGLKTGKLSVQSNF